MRARLRTAARILELEERLRLQATHDTLTGLLNHGAIIEVLRKELARAHRQRGVVAHLTADLDRFKQINDTYGHLAGDAVLREVAARIRSSVREYDSVGRAGGDEFLIVAPGCGIPEGMTVAARIRDTVTSQLITAGDAALNVGISLGVAVGCGAADEDVDALLRAADSALYQSKRNGRGQARAFEPKLTSAFAPPGRTPTARNLRVARTRSSTPDHDD